MILIQIWYFHPRPCMFALKIKQSEDRKRLREKTRTICWVVLMCQTYTLNETRLVEREIPNIMDRHVLIAEIRKRPELWDYTMGKRQGRVCIPDMWKDVAQIVGADVEQCKRKWKNLRDAYRSELKRIEGRIENDILKGIYNTKNDYNSKWVFFEPMSFIQPSMKRARPSIENENSSENYNYEDNNDYVYDSQFNSVCDIKSEPQHSMEEDDDNDNSLQYADDEDDNTLFNPSDYYDKPPALSRRPANTMVHNMPKYNHQYNNDQDNNAECYKNTSQYLPTAPLSAYRRAAKITIKKFAPYPQPQQQQRPFPSDHQPSTSKSNSFGKLPQQNDEQMNFLENLEKEEQNLITSTRRDITHSNKMDHIGDSDYNFLVSFLPQMKKMTELQNLQFRAKMSEMVLNVLSPSMPQS